MEDSGAYEECIGDLRQKLLRTTIQLEIERLKANDAIAKHKEHLTHLLYLLKTAYQERDEAREQLQNLLKNTSSPTETASALSQNQHPNFHGILKTDSVSVTTESNALTEIYHHSAQALIPANSFRQGANHARHQRQTFSHYNNNPPSTYLASSESADLHRASLMIDKLIEEKSLPQKGTLLQAVIEAGPLLETLLVVGPLPKWKNPPPLHPLKPPPTPVSKKACHPTPHQEKPSTVSRGMNQKSVILGQSVNSGIAHQRCLASMPNVAGRRFHPYSSKSGELTSGSCIHNQTGVGNRQRTQ